MTGILVLLTIIAAVAVDVMIVRRRQQVPAMAAARRNPMLVPQPPQGLFVAPGHSWARITTEGTLRVGIDDFLAEAAGDIEAVEVAARGTRVERGEPLLKLRVGGRVLAVAAPVSGEVVSINQKAVESPWMVTRDPYGVGWLASVWTRDHQEAIRPLRIGSGAVAYLREELDRFVDFLTRSASPATAPVLADGGLPFRGSLANLDDEQLHQFEREFLAADQE